MVVIKCGYTRGDKRKREKEKKNTTYKIENSADNLKWKGEINQPGSENWTRGREETNNYC